MNQIDAPTGPFAFGTFAGADGVFPGFVVDGTVYDIRGVLPSIHSTADLFEAWDDNLDAVQRAADDSDTLNRLGGTAVAALDVRPPVQPVGPILAAGANYREHILQMSVAHQLGRSDATVEELWDEAAVETDERRRSGDPYVWTGIPSAVSGAFDDLQLPDVGDEIDWEVELGVVIGRRAHRVSREDAFDHVAGYTIVNDITARTLVPRHDMAQIGTDWFRAKNQPTFFPTGPYLVPARFVPDPTRLRIEFRLNGEVKQDATTDDLLFDIPSLIAYASSLVILQPGDLLITGSPAGNGSHWKRFLRAGDVMNASISGLGGQRNVVRERSNILPPWQASRSGA
ncbi:fumarylacetoacetate hydrolase family protein [Microbacterium foliorum]|uniref:fumarylacetoacetate hydrolase family protein n=1 Tax=Microbacterium foliorum TaxID=104336 RepID=UPI003734C640